MISTPLLVGLLALGSAFAVPLAKRAVSGPVISSEFRDPSFVWANVGDAVAYASSGFGMNIPTAHTTTTTDFNVWELENVDALPVVGAWSTGNNIVAPDVIRLVSRRPHQNLYFIADTVSILSRRTRRL